MIKLPYDGIVGKVLPPLEVASLVCKGSSFGNGVEFLQAIDQVLLETAPRELDGEILSTWKFLCQRVVAALVRDH